MTKNAGTPDDERRSRNLRTGIVLATVAAAFFFGLLLKQYLLTH